MAPSKFNDFLNEEKFNDLYFIEDSCPLNNTILDEFMQFAKNLSRSQEIKRTEVSASDLNLAYYDNCLLQYCFDVLDKGICHYKTCWVKKCERVVSLGLDEWGGNTYKNVTTFHKQNKSLTSQLIWKFMKKFVWIDGENWLFINYLPPLNLSLLDLVRRLRFLFYRTLKTKTLDRVIYLIENIKLNGWRNDEFEKPYRTVLIYYRNSGKYAIFTGRHRIAAAKYLHHHGILENDFNFNLPVISVPWKEIRTSRPHPRHQKCSSCNVCK